MMASQIKYFEVRGSVASSRVNLTSFILRHVSLVTSVSIDYEYLKGCIGSDSRSCARDCTIGRGIHARAQKSGGGIAPENRGGGVPKSEGGVEKNGKINVLLLFYYQNFLPLFPK